MSWVGVARGDPWAGDRMLLEDSIRIRASACASADSGRCTAELTVWNRTAATAEQFCAEHRATLAATPTMAAAAAEVLVTMVVDGSQVEEVLLGEGGALKGASAGLLFIDCSTIGPTATRAIGVRLAERGVAMVDAPVTGSAPRAQDGTLTIMAGGSPEDFERARPVREAMGELIVHAGPLGHGQMGKLINDALAA